MPWEWHDRQRDAYGRYTDERGARGTTEQFHIRLTPAQADMIRNRAKLHHMEYSRYVWACLVAAWGLEPMPQLPDAGDNMHTNGGAGPYESAAKGTGADQRQDNRIPRAPAPFATQQRPAKRNPAAAGGTANASGPGDD